jgi:hypothetical protein
MADENHGFLDFGLPTNFEYDLSVLEELGNFVAEDKVIAKAPLVGVHASPGDSLIDRSHFFVHEHLAKEGDVQPSPPQFNAFETRQRLGAIETQNNSHQTVELWPWQLSCGLGLGLGAGPDIFLAGTARVRGRWGR